MRTTTRHAIFQPSVLAVAIAIGCVAPVQAVTFNIGEVEGQFDSSLSVGPVGAYAVPTRTLSVRVMAARHPRKRTMMGV